MRPLLLSAEIALLEILNGDRADDLTLYYLSFSDRLFALGLLETTYEGIVPINRISPLGEAWLAHYHRRVH